MQADIFMKVDNNEEVLHRTNCLLYCATNAMYLLLQ